MTPRRFALAGLVALALGVQPLIARAATEAPAPPEQPWSFDGLFGTYDLASAQRGYQVYAQVCSACHGLSHLAYRHLGDLGYSADQVSALASQFTVTAGPDANGDMFERPAVPADTFKEPFPNKAAAQAANGGAYPPDLSVFVEARAGGADYLDALLTGYHEPPAGVEVRPGLYYNTYFPGHQIAMPPPLQEGIIEYTDGTPATVDQMSHDVTMFLTWASEPNLETRKQMGLKVILYLIVLTGLLYATKRKLWSSLH
ncbi:MAG: cytochrome c1 [Acetobacterales bacterium]